MSGDHNELNPDFSRDGGPGGAWVLGITGGIAAGKSEAGRILARRGYEVCDTDALAHRLMEPGTEVHQAVAEAFGAAMLNADGTISRAVLGKTVFENPEALKRLNALVHPAVIQEVERLKTEARARSSSLAVLVPLLFEAGMEHGWDAVLCVTAPEAVVLERLRDRNLGEAEARRRMAAQMPPEEKAARADYQIVNDSTLDVLQKRMDSVLCRIRDERSRNG